MDIQTKKRTVLYQLRQETEPTSLRKLLEKLGKDFAERSVRRWLNELIKEGLVEKQGLKQATKYQVLHRGLRSNK